MSYPLRAVAVVTALGLATGITLWTVNDGSGKAPQGQGTVDLGRTQTIALTTAHDCTDLLEHYKTEAERVVGPYGLNGGPDYGMAASGSAEMVPTEKVGGGAIVPGARSAAPASDAGQAAGVPDSTTNVQVSGVDESDVMKTSGDLMVSAVNGTVRITRLAGRQTKTLAKWRPADGSAQSVLLDGTKAVILSDLGGWGAGVRPMMATSDIAMPSGPTADPGVELTVLDLADPSNPRPIRRLHIDGTRSGEARLVDGELRLAVTAGPTGLAWKQPVYANRPMSPAELLKTEKRSTAANRKLIAKSTIANWIPEATVTSLNAAGKPAGPTLRRPLLDCEDVAIPGSFSGLQTLALVSVDLRADAPLSTWNAAGVIAAGSTLYATADRVWLATARWESPVASSAKMAIRFAPTTASTQIHLFDTPVRAEPKYVASGEVPGSLLNQFAMDERGGLLRVATTTQASWGGATESMVGPGEVVQPPSVEGSEGSDVAPDTAVKSPKGPTPIPVKPSQGRITVLSVDGDRLVQTGVLTGLGVGEQIRGVRFDGDIGYVVTYRQTDPLYTVDLSDPKHPLLRGELKLPGYSAYLHPAGAGRVLGLGQDGTETGQVTGLQLSLFDVTNLDAPHRLDRQRLSGAWSDAEADHHAFTMAGNLALIPYSSWTSDAQSKNGVFRQRFDAGVIAVRVGSDSIGASTILRPIANGPINVDDGSKGTAQRDQKVLQATPLRTAVHDDTIYTLTPEGIAVHSATTLTRETFTAF
jgi:Beta propeller domain